MLRGVASTFLASVAGCSGTRAKLLVLQAVGRIRRPGSCPDNKKSRSIGEGNDAEGSAGPADLPHGLNDQQK